MDHPKINQDIHLARAWNERVSDRLVDLLSAMSTALGYTFSTEELRRGIYYPKGRVDLEQSQLAIMHGLSNIIQGKASLPMAIKEFPASPELALAQAELARKAAGAYDEHDGALRIKQIDNAQPKPARTAIFGSGLKHPADLRALSRARNLR